VTVISATLLVMDIVENFPAEIEYVWMREWSFITVLYIIQRYLPIFDSVVVLFRNDFATNLSLGQCTTGYRFITWSCGIGIMLSEIILTLRVWTVWKRGTRVTIGLLVLFFGCWVPAFVFLGKFLGSLQLGLLPHGRGCSISGGTNILFVFWLMMMVYETGNLTMLLICGVRVYHRGGRTELTMAVYRDGKPLIALAFSVPSSN
ncbi:hypothetical protein L218DRAFT_1067889, partial [Marasmius fiardii PR-910]